MHIKFTGLTCKVGNIQYINNTDILLMTWTEIRLSMNALVKVKGRNMKRTEALRVHPCFVIWEGIVNFLGLDFRADAAFGLIRSQAFLFSFFLIAFGVNSWAQSPADERPLLYAGFAFAGNYAHRDYLYPHTASLSTKKPGFLDEVLRSKVQSRPNLLKRLSLGKGSSKEDITSVACTLVQENIEIQRIDGKYVVIALMQANVLGFNRASSAIVASYPLRMRFTRTRDVEPTRSDLEAIVQEAYTSTNPAENLFDQWLGKLETTRFKYGTVKYLRITDVVVAPEAQVVLQQAGVHLKAFENKTANLLEAELADKANVPIVPNSEGEVGNKMSLRFDNADSIGIQLPEPDYAVKFLVRGFAAATTESAGAYTDIYRSKATLTITLPGTEKVYIDEQVYDTRFVTRPKSSDVQFAKWDQFNKSLQVLLADLSKQLVNPDDEWLKEHATRKVEAKPAFLQVKQLFQDL